MKLLVAAAFVGLLPLLVMSANLGHTTTTTVQAVHARHGHTWNVRWHGPAQHLHVLREIKQHDEWVVGNAGRYHFAADLTAFHRREWRHAMRKILWAKANLIDPVCGKVPPGPCSALVHVVHPCEGPWNAYTPPFYGGLQMDLDFQRTYGGEFYRRWGTANNWPIWAQVTAGYRGVIQRGYQPWPVCGRSLR